MERNQKVIYDSHVITASYLIRNIDHAFGMWEKQPWGKYIKFEDFCEYILPYRVAFEPLSEWERDLCRGGRADIGFFVYRK